MGKLSIGADAARLAGLLIDFCQKHRSGIITADHFRWFINLSEERRDELCGFQDRQKFLKLKQFLRWLEENGLNDKLAGGLIGQIAEQERFYQKFYGNDFFINRKKILIDPKRLPAIKAGLEEDSVNYALIKATPEKLSEAEVQMTEAEFFFERIMKPLKKDGFKIWAEEGTDRWTNLKLKELLQRGNPAEPEEFNAEAFKKEWSKEIIKILSQKSSPPKVRAGIVELNFTSNLADISKDQVIINKDGEKVTPDDRSYVSAIASGVRVLSHAEGIILMSQMFSKDKTYLAPNTWEWRRDLIDHRDKGTSSNVSVARVFSRDGVFSLNSSDADLFSGGNRLRLAL